MSVCWLSGALILYGTVIVAPGPSATRSAARPDDGPEEILNQRLPREGISIEQYEQLRATIRDRSAEEATV